MRLVSYIVQAPTSHLIEWLDEEIPEMVIEMMPDLHLGDLTEPLPRGKGVPRMDGRCSWWVIRIGVLINVHLLPCTHSSIHKQRPDQVQHSQNRSLAGIVELTRCTVTKEHANRITRMLQHILGVVRVDIVDVVILLTWGWSDDERVRRHS